MTESNAIPPDEIYPAVKQMLMLSIDLAMPDRGDTQAPALSALFEAGIGNRAPSWRRLRNYRLARAAGKLFCLARRKARSPKTLDDLQPTTWHHGL